MPYYYPSYGYSDFLANNIYVLLLIPILALSLWAQFQVSGSFRRYSQQTNRRRITGAQAAEAVLRAHGVYDVPIRPCRGNLTDHYDPRDNTIYLSENVYNAPTIAAWAWRLMRRDMPCSMRKITAPSVCAAPSFPPRSWVPSSPSSCCLPAFCSTVRHCCWRYCALSLTTIFQLVTLPVEFNASARAIETIDGQMLLDSDELPGAKKVLRAAAMTYVAALLMSALQLLRFVLIFLGRNNRGGGRD